MQISRRDLLRSSAVVAGVTAAGGLGLAEEAVAGTVPSQHAARRLTRRVTTRRVVLEKGQPGRGGYRPVVEAAGETHLVRSDLGAEPKRGRRTRRKPLIAFAQISDVHIVDSESPMRLEYADAYSSSAYRPQEFLTMHVAESMVQGINAVRTGPVTGKPLSFVLQTGDNADNAQHNEVRWNIDLLDGGPITPNSGDLAKTESVSDNSDPTYYFTQYWHPEGTAGDLPRSTWGFPTVPGLLAAARAPFMATGLDIPWYSVMGNHDKLVQGNNAPDADSQSTAAGASKEIVATRFRPVTADPNRRELSTLEIIQEHFTTTGLPVGHGYTSRNLRDRTAYYTFDKGLLRFVVMDSVNANGDDDGAINLTQLAWLRRVLDSARGKKLVIVSSHHTSWTMNSPVTGSKDPGPRVHGNAVVAELLRHRCVIAWINGHTHANKVVPHVRKKKGKVVNGFWEINTASHIDWPQQGRLIEVADNRDGTLSIFATMVDHAAPASWDATRLDDPLQLAALSRELAANDWQERDRNRRGTRGDRNLELVVRAPRFLR